MSGVRGDRTDKVLSAAVLVCSDRGARGERQDLTGPAIADWLADQGVRVVETALLADERAEIAARLAGWCDDTTADLIVTCGGTGVAPRDVTPEATLDVIEREVPGLAEAMRLRSLASSPHAPLSRAVAGVRGRTLVVNLPGSPRAARENLAAVWPAISHGVAKIQGDMSDCARAVPEQPAAAEEVALGEVTAAILAGGRSRRMGQDKALLTVGGRRLIEAVHEVLAGLFREVLVVAKDPDRFGFLDARGVRDRLPQEGPLVGIHAALETAATPFVFVVGCDMPSLQPAVIRDLAGRPRRWDVVVPDLGRGRTEPLHARFATACLPAVAALLADGSRPVSSLFDQVRTLRVPAAELLHLDPAGRSFRNLNTPADAAAWER